MLNVIEPLRIKWLLAFTHLLFVAGSTSVADSQEPTAQSLQSDFTKTISPFLQQYCVDCHSGTEPEAKLDLSGFRSAADVSDSHPTWELLLRRLQAGDMPPAEATAQPRPEQLRATIDWIEALRRHDAERNAGDPGIVLARRLSHAEYNNTIRDLTGIDMRPTSTFPVDPANEAGFDNTGASLTMSPALLAKYLDAARLVAEHLVFTPSGLSFAPHPVATETDRDKYCVKRIVAFYERQPTDLANYFLVCWQTARESSDPGIVEERLTARAEAAGISRRYAATVWDLLHRTEAIGVIETLQSMFRDLPREEQAARHECKLMSDYVANLRPLLSPHYGNLEIDEVHSGSQSFVLWKNEQYATHRRQLNRGVLYTAGEEVPEGTRPELILPSDPTAQELHLQALMEFCAVFPDAFYVSERGRDRRHKTP